MPIRSQPIYESERLPNGTYRCYRCGRCFDLAQDIQHRTLKGCGTDQDLIYVGLARDIEGVWRRKPEPVAMKPKWRTDISAEESRANKAASRGKGALQYSRYTVPKT